MSNAYEPARIPTNEAARLKSVHRTGVMDVEQKNRFQIYIEMAKALCDCPVAYTGLLDEERQYFMAHAFPAGMDPSEYPRKLTLCQYALLDTNPLIVPDLRLHAKLQNNPLVTGAPHFVFWAGFPLVTKDGLVMGTLCVVDFEPRTLSAEQISLMQDLAANLSLLLDLQADQTEFVAPRALNVLEALDSYAPNLSINSVKGFLKLCCDEPLTTDEAELVIAIDLAELDPYGNARLNMKGREIQAKEGLTSAVYKKRKQAVVDSHNVEELFDLL